MVFKSMDTLELSTRWFCMYQVVQDRRQVLPWIGLVFDLQGKGGNAFSAPYFTGDAAGHGSNESDLDQGPPGHFSRWRGARHRRPERSNCRTGAKRRPADDIGGVLSGRRTYRAAGVDQHASSF